MTPPALFVPGDRVSVTSSYMSVYLRTTPAREFYSEVSRQGDVIKSQEFYSGMVLDVDCDADLPDARVLSTSGHVGWVFQHLLEPSRGLE